MEKIVFVFNKFYTGLIKDVKNNTNDDLKTKVRKNYKAIDKMSSEYVDFFLTGGDFKEPLDHERFVLKDITIKEAVDAIEAENDKEVFWNYFYVLAVLGLVYKEYKDATADEETVDVLGKSVLEILTKKQKGEDVSEDASNILHDDIQAIIGKIKRVDLGGDVPKPEGAPCENPFTSMFKGMENSKICNLAQEISNEVDVSKIKADSPEDIMKLLDFSGSNNIMGDIIKKVSSKMHEKLSNGELKQDDLFSEAIGLMGKMSGGNGGGLGSLFNNPMMSEIFKMAKKNQVKPKSDPRGSSSRERLRKKLEERRATGTK
jgi:hypothetical protein